MCQQLETKIIDLVHRLIHRLKEVDDRTQENEMKNIGSC